MCCSLTHSHKEPPCKPLKLIVPAQIFTADLTPRCALHIVPQPGPFNVCSHHICIPSVLAQPHLALSRYEASTLLLPLPEKELLIEGYCTLSAEGSCWQRHPRAACALAWFLAGWLFLQSPATQR